MFFTLVCRSFLAMLFFVAAVSKVLPPRAFATWRQSVDDLPFLLPALRAWIAFVVPALELAAAVGLAGSSTAPAALFGSAAMLLGFAAAVALATADGRELTCRCFGQDGVSLTRGRARINVVLGLYALACGCYLTARGSSSPDPALLVFSLGLSGLAVLVMTRWQDVAFLFDDPGAGPA